MNLRALLNALTGRKSSKDVAKERLRLVLVHDWLAFLLNF